MRLKLQSLDLLSSYAFKFNLRRYNMVAAAAAHYATVAVDTAYTSELGTAVEVLRRVAAVDASALDSAATECYYAPYLDKQRVGPAIIHVSMVESSSHWVGGTAGVRKSVCCGGSAKIVIELTVDSHEVLCRATSLST
jgi:hypothetical protein